MSREVSAEEFWAAIRILDVHPTIPPGSRYPYDSIFRDRNNREHGRIVSSRTDRGVIEERHYLAD